MAFEKFPIENCSEIGTPSNSTATRFPPIPRRITPSEPKRVPLRAASIPGT